MLPQSERDALTDALVWVRELRYWVLLGGVLLHVGIDYTMNIPLFGFIMWVALKPFRRLTTMVSPNADPFNDAAGALGDASDKAKRAESPWICCVISIR